jgi:hypothetical protein
MKKKTAFLSGMAALALAIFTSAAVPAGADPLPGTKWLGILGPQGFSGPSYLEFTTAGNAIGTFGVREDMEFIYTLDSGQASGTLIETSTKYDWNFVLGTDPVLNRVTMVFEDMAPYGKYEVPQTFYRILFPQSAVPADLTDTNWLGTAGKMGETLLDNITYDEFEGTGTLDCTIGPNTPMTGLEFTYDGVTGKGNVDELGDFVIESSGSTVVLTFTNFMGIGPYEFDYFTYDVPVTMKPAKVR